jgi:membrane-bound lytic murein transglycosylase A
LGNEVFAGRTIATDVRYFPKGALAFLQFRRPVFSAAVGDEVSNWQEVSRFVFDQDTGGAIRGGGRADLFWGSGAEAKRFAGVIKDDRARLYYLVPSNIDYLTQGVRE